MEMTLRFHYVGIRRHLWPLSAFPSQAYYLWSGVSLEGPHIGTRC